MRIELTQGYYAIVDAEDFDRLNKFSWHAFTLKSKTRIKPKIFAKRCLEVNGTIKSYYMQQDVLILYKDLRQRIIHINGDSLDNRKSNLKIATKSQIQQSKYVDETNTASRFRGVSWSKRNEIWEAEITVRNEIIRLGSFSDEIEAAKAYDDASSYYHKEFGARNFGDDYGMRNFDHDKPKPTPTTIRRPGAGKLWE